MLGQPGCSLEAQLRKAHKGLQAARLHDVTPHAAKFAKAAQRALPARPVSHLRPKPRCKLSHEELGVINITPPYALPDEKRSRAT